MKKDERDAPYFIDRFGHTIPVGGTIVYGNNLGRCAKTAIGQILRIYTVPDPWREDLNRRKIHLKVASVQDDTGHYREKPYIKNVTLSETERVLKYEWDSLPRHIQQLLEKGEDKYRCTCWTTPAEGQPHLEWCKAPKRPK